MTREFQQHLETLRLLALHALKTGDNEELASIATAFDDCSLQPGYDASAQADWLAEMLSQTSFAESRKLHGFTTSIFLYRDKLGGASIQRLSDALLFALPKLKDEADLVSTMEFLVKVPTPAFALDILNRLSTFSSDQLLKPFVWDAMRMYSIRQDISPVQLATVRALAGNKGKG